MNFAQLPTGYTIDSGTLSAVDISDNSDASSTVLASTTASVSGTKLTTTVQAGTSGSTYKITFSATLTPSGGPLNEDVYMVVDDF